MKSEARLVKAKDESAVKLEIDGLKVASLLSELTFEYLGSEHVRRGLHDQGFTSTLVEWCTRSSKHDPSTNVDT